MRGSLRGAEAPLREGDRLVDAARQPERLRVEVEGEGAGRPGVAGPVGHGGRIEGHGAAQCSRWGTSRPAGRGGRKMPVRYSGILSATRRKPSAVSRKTSGARWSGKPEVVRLAVVGLVARGHLLIEDVPGVGKTTLARALARSIGAGVPAHPVHQRPAAVRRPRRLGLRPETRRVRLQAGPDLHQRGARRRDQPHHAARPSRRCSRR